MPPELAKEARDLLSKSSKGYPPSGSLSLDDSRRLLDEKILRWAESAEVDETWNFNIDGPSGGIPVRAYHPSVSENLPILVYLHGGGWVRGSIESHDPLCRLLAKESGCVVVSVDYRQPPEHKFPAALHDSFAAVEWATNYGSAIGGDSRTVLVGGDSAGGNLAAAVSLLARERNSPDIAYQVLLYPVLNNIAVQEFESYTEFEDDAGDYTRGRSSLIISREAYFESDVAWFNQFAHPLQAATLENLPPSLMLSCHFDVLRDENFAYADALESAGVSVDRLHFDDMFHPFLCFTQLDATKSAVRDIGTAIQSAV